MAKLNSKLVVITGSAGGLGKAFAETLLQLGLLSSILKYYWLILPSAWSGAKVCISDINEKLGEETLRELRERFGDEKVAFQACDVTREESVRTLIEEAERKLKSPLYCFINNAGSHRPDTSINSDPCGSKQGHLIT